MPTIFAKGLIDLNDSAAMFAKFAPERDVSQDRHIQPELAGRLLVIHLHQGAAKGLIGYLSFAADENIRRNFLAVARDFARDAQAAIVLVNAFVQRVGHAETIAAFERGSGEFQECRLDEIVSAEEREIFGFGGEFQTAIAIAEKAKVGRIANPFAIDGLKFFDDLLGCISRAIVEDDDSIRAERLPGYRFESLLDKLLAVIDGNNRDDVGSHYDRRLNNLES